MTTITATRQVRTLQPTSTGRRGTHKTRRECQVCGSAARVRILHHYHAGEPVTSYLCLACAAAEPRVAAANRESRIHTSSVVIIGGLLFLAAGLLADLQVVHVSFGFGAYQRSGAALSIIAVLVGLLTRADMITLAGMGTLGLCLGADWFGGARSPGMGWRQQTLLLAGFGIMLVGIAVRFWRASRRARTQAA